MSPALCAQVRRSSTAPQNWSSWLAVPCVLQSIAHVLFVHFCLTAPAWRSSQWFSAPQVLPGNEPFGKHAFSLCGLKQEKPLGHAPATHAITHTLFALSEHVRLASTP